MQALEGIKIIDFTRLLPGPLGTHLLSQFGAEIYKIESPKRMDYTRFYDPKINGVSTMYHCLNHDKKEIIVDYETAEGYAKIVTLIKECDVFIEQFRPGAMQKFKLDFNTVKAINPAIVYISVTGYGQTGNLKDKAGHDLNYIAQAGLLDLNRDTTGKPVIPGYQVADIAGGSYMLLAACTTGLLAQNRQQKAQYIDVNLAKATLPLNAIAQGMQHGKASYKSTPILSGMLVNYNVYQCADTKWVALGALELKFWNSFCDKLGKSSWQTSNQEDLVAGIFDKTALEALFLTKTRDEWINFFKEEDICISPVLEIEELVEFHTTNKTNAFKEINVDGHTMYVYSEPFTVSD